MARRLESGCRQTQNHKKPYKPYKPYKPLKGTRFIRFFAVWLRGWDQAQPKPQKTVKNRINGIGINRKKLLRFIPFIRFIRFFAVLGSLGLLRIIWFIRFFSVFCCFVAQRLESGCRQTIQTRSTCSQPFLLHHLKLHQLNVSAMTRHALSCKPQEGHRFEVGAESRKVKIHPWLGQGKFKTITSIDHAETR